MAVVGAASAISGASLWLAALTLLAAALIYGAVILAPARRGGAPGCATAAAALG